MEHKGKWKKIKLYIVPICGGSDFELSVLILKKKYSLNRKSAEKKHTYFLNIP